MLTSFLVIYNQQQSFVKTYQREKVKCKKSSCILKDCCWGNKRMERILLLTKKSIMRWVICNSLMTKTSHVGIKEGFRRKRKFKMVFAIRRRTLPPLMAQIFIHLFTPPFFLLQLNPTYMKRILHFVPLKNIVFKSSYNWFKYWHSSAALVADCQLLLYLAMFIVTSTTIYT